MTGTTETFQLSLAAAEAYEARFVPAIFGEWAPHLVEAAGVAPGQAVLAVDGGTVAVQVWDRLEAQAGYRPFFEVVARHAGEDAIELWSAYWALGDLELLAALFQAAGLRVTTTRTHDGAVRFASTDELVRTEIEATPLGERIGPEVHARLLEDAGAALHRFVTAGGRVELPIRGHLVVARA